MNKNIFKIIGAVLLLAGGAVVVIVMNQSVWFDEQASIPTDKLCPHGLVVDTCAFCDESLIEELGFCRGHGVPEAFCTRCNRSLIVAFKNINDWCAEHDLPESQCTICHPDLLDEKAVQEVNSRQSAPIKSFSASNLELKQDKHLLRSRQSPSADCTTESLIVQFVTPQTVKDAGLEYQQIVEKKITETVTCNAEIAYDGNRFAHLSSRASGIVNQVKKDLGASVKKGDILALIDSTDLGMAKAEYLQAHALRDLWQRNFDREKGLMEKHAATERDTIEAETKLTESKIACSRSAQRLKNLGLDDVRIKNIILNNDTSSLLPLSAPFDGVLVERKAVIGEVVDQSHVLFALADTSRMWATLDIYEADVAKIRLEQSVVVDIESLRGERHRGRITWISTAIDPQTRTLKGRVEFSNPQGLLKARMFGKATVTVKDETPSIVVLKSAVQWEGCCNIVFVKRSDYVFEPRKIKIEYEGDSFYVIAGNVKLGETIVTTGSFLLKTEILKGSIGAGCCEIDPGK